jgi:hypothetical protein
MQSTQPKVSLWREDDVVLIGLRRLKQNRGSIREALYNKISDGKSASVIGRWKCHGLNRDNVHLEINIRNPSCNAVETMDL